MSLSDLVDKRKVAPARNGRIVRGDARSVAEERLKVETLAHYEERKREQRAERAGERMRKLHADPEFARANAERMRKLNADPEFARANAERMRKLHADPEFEAKRIKALRRAAAARRKNT